jgi:CRP-like cAMP-binding protein
VASKPPGDRDDAEK